MALPPAAQGPGRQTDLSSPASAILGNWGAINILLDSPSIRGAQGPISLHLEHSQSQVTPF